MYLDAWHLIFRAHNVSAGNFPSRMYEIIGSIYDHFCSICIIPILCLMLGKDLTSIGADFGIFRSAIATILAKISTWRFSLLGICTIATYLNFPIICLAFSKYCCILSFLGWNLSLIWLATSCEYVRTFPLFALTVWVVCGLKLQSDGVGDLFPVWAI